MPIPEKPKLAPLPAEAGLDWQPFLSLMLLITGTIYLAIVITVWVMKETHISLLRQSTTPTATLTPRATFTSTPIVTRRVTPTNTPWPTPTSTRVVKIEVIETTTAQQALTQTEAEASPVSELSALLAARPLSVAPATAPTVPHVSHTRASHLVLAQYFAWFDADGWDNCNMSASDKPLEPYNSDDPTAIARHIQMALDIGLNGFTMHWFAPGERTDRNFETLLARSQGLNFYSTLVFSRHIWHGPAATQQNIVDAMRYILDHYTTQPNFLYLEQKPVLFFTDVYRVPLSHGQTPPQFWAAVRNEVDPQRHMWWIAEGLDSSYLAVFDGLYVFKITHADYPDDYLKDSRWAEQVRAWQQRTGQPKLWLATISPGWDDLHAGCRADVRAPTKLYRRARQDGDLYHATFDAAMASNPDWLLVSSFNEWVEGTYIEPSVLYGRKYMEMTQTFVRRFQDK